MPSRASRIPKPSILTRLLTEQLDNPSGWSRSALKSHGHTVALPHRPPADDTRLDMAQAPQLSP